MSNKEEKQEEIMGPEVKDTNVSETNNVNDTENVMSNADEGTHASIAPSLEGVSDTESIGIIEQNKRDNNDQNTNDLTNAFPSLFVNKEDLMEIVVEIIFDPSNGDVYSISQPGLINTAMLDVLSSVNYTFKFKPVSYDDMQKYRRQASFYNSTAGDLVVNRLSLRNLFLINHLRETDMIDENGEVLVLEIDPDNDNLSLNAINKMYQTLPALLDVVLTLFERKLLILFQAGQTNM